MADPTAFDEQQDKSINQLNATVAELSRSQADTEHKLNHSLAIVGAMQKLLEPALNIQADVEALRAKVDGFAGGPIAELHDRINEFVTGPFAELKKIVDDIKAFVDNAKSKFKTGF